MFTDQKVYKEYTQPNCSNAGWLIKPKAPNGGKPACVRVQLGDEARQLAQTDMTPDQAELFAEHLVQAAKDAREAQAKLA